MVSRLNMYIFVRRVCCCTFGYPMYRVNTTTQKHLYIYIQLHYTHVCIIVVSCATAPPGISNVYRTIIYYLCQREPFANAANRDEIAKLCSGTPSLKEPCSSTTVLPFGTDIPVRECRHFRPRRGEFENRYIAWKTKR